MSNIHIQNQKPVIFKLDQNFLPNIDVTLDEPSYMDKLAEHVEATYVTPLFNARNAQASVTIQDLTDPQNPIDYDAQMLTSAMMSLLENPDVDATLNNELKSILLASMRYTTANREPFEMQPSMQLFARYKQPLPSPGVVIYSPQSDVIPAAKDLFDDWTDANFREMFALSITGMLFNNPILQNVTIVACETKDQYDTFLNTMQTVASNYNAHVTNETRQSLTDVQNVKMNAGDLSTTWILPRVGSGDDVQQYSFNRIIMNELSKLNVVNDKMYPLPTHLHTMYKPQAIMFLNIEEFTHASAKAVKDEFQMITSVMNRLRTFNMVNMKRLSTAQAVHQSQNRQNNSGYTKKQHGINRIKYTKLRSKPYTSKSQIQIIAKIIASKVSQQQSQNQFKTIKQTYMRPNRRFPDSLDHKGKMKKVAYRPDIHIYLDTSGSISESNYKTAIMNLIKIAMKLKVNMYFNSFSHVISDEVLLETANKTSKQLYKEFERVPKVTGGTDFSNVWDFIDMTNAKVNAKNQAPRINFIISDMEYTPSNNRKMNANDASVKNTYYVPIVVGADEYQMIAHCAKRLIESMQLIGHKNARKHFIM